MPARDTFHQEVINALTADGWTITDDPLHLVVDKFDMYVDLGAEKNTLAAEKGGQRIAVEIKCFLHSSTLRNIEDALGQYRLYLGVLAELEPDRKLYLAVPLHVYDSFFMTRLGQIVMRHDNLSLLVFDPKKEVIHKWIN